MAGAHLASRPKRRALRSVPGETPRIPPQPRMPRAGHRDRSTASIDHRHRKIPPAFASNHLRSIRHYGIRMESERRRIGEVLRSIQLRQKDRDARWTVKYTKAKPREDGSTPPVDLAIPVFGYQNHISLDR